MVGKRRDRDDREDEKDAHQRQTEGNERDTSNVPRSKEEPNRSLSDVEVSTADAPSRDFYDTETNLEQATPRRHLESRTYTEMTIPTARPPVRETVKHEVTHTAQPADGTDKRNSAAMEVQVAQIGDDIRERVTDQVTKQAQPSTDTDVNEKPRVTVSRPPDQDFVEDTMTKTVELSTQSGGQMTDEEFEDPVFNYSGSPYNTTRPRIVIHKNPNIDGDEDSHSFQTVAFLQRLLRDAYTELEGGEPRADTAEVRSDGEVRIPDVENSITTLDLTGDSFQAAVQHRKERPKIKYEGVDIVPDLKEFVSTLYAGDLGYLIVDIPSKWDYEADPIEESFVEKLCVFLTDDEGSSTDSTTGGIHDMRTSSPVIVAEPKTTEPDELLEKTKSYFSLVDSAEARSVGQVEETQQTALRKESWQRIALTRKQRTESESDQHYFWKAAIVEGLAKRLYNEEDGGFGDFVKGLDEIKTEEGKDPNGNSDDDQVYPDIVVETSPDYTNDDFETALSGFLGEAYDGEDLAIEFETGRSEGTFNFRKIRDTIQKYQNSNGETPNEIALVIPQRLLFRGKRRAKMIFNLVEQWEVDGNSANIYIPLLLKDEFCIDLEQVDEAYIDELYEVEDDE